jgi:hypothetical protein
VIAALLSPDDSASAVINWLIREAVADRAMLTAGPIRPSEPQGPESRALSLSACRARSHRSHAVRLTPGGKRSRIARRNVTSAARLIAFFSMATSVI